jgi:hypothetical protein
MPTYTELWEQGDLLLRRLEAVAGALAVMPFLSEIRSWQLRCRALVARRDAGSLAEFRDLAGPLQRLALTPDWKAAGAATLLTGLIVVDWLRLVALEDGHAEIVARFASIANLS